MKTKKLAYLLVATGLLTTVSSSCEKWFDVQPRSLVKSSELFESEAGYKEALAGIYTILTDQAAYGKELTYGMMGVLSREWSNFPTAYTDDSEYNYTATLSEMRINGVWNKMYNAISNTNHLLANIDKEDVSFTGNNRDIIKGEALALRALIHFDLLRCFGVNYATNPDQPAIPYVTEYTHLQTKQSAVKEVAALVIDDLIAAKKLLTADPIYTGQTVTEFNDNGYLINRQLHLNYYAVEALLARVYMYIGDYEKAKTAAQNVIESEKFEFTSQDDYLNQVDLSGASEQIFGLQINTINQLSEDYLSQEGSVVFSLDDADRKLYFNTDVTTNDYRLMLLGQGTQSHSSENYYTLKYTASTSTEAYYQDKMPIIKLSEMYLILAEATWKTDGDPLPAFNAYIQAKGLNALLTLPPNFQAELTNEYRKEFLAEGQLFYYYKRLNTANIYGTDVNLVNTKSYTFPLPNNEYNGANRQANK